MATLTSALLIECRDMEEQYRRVWELNADERMLSNLDSVMRHNLGNVSPSVIGEVMGSAFHQSADHIIGTDIRWADPRFMFILEVTDEDMDRNGGRGSRTFITGYTDGSKYNSSDEIDGKTRMYVNSVIQVKDIDMNTHVRTTVYNNMQLITGDYDISGGKNDYLMRPEDIFSTMNRVEDLGEAAADADDSRVMFDTGVKTTSRENNVGSSMLSRLISGDIDSYATMRYSSSSTDTAFRGNRNSNSIDFIRERCMSKVDFIHQMSRINEYFEEDGFFTYDDLIGMCRGRSFRDLDDVTTFIPFEDNDLDYSGEQWRGADNETLSAVKVCHAVPTFMVQSLMQAVSFNCSNEDSRSGEPEFEVTKWSSFAGRDFDDESVVQALRARFINEVFNVISDYGRRTVDIEVDADIGGVTKMYISFEYGATDEFTFASFGDSALVPTVTDSNSDLVDMSKRYGNIRNVVDDVLNAHGENEPGRRDSRESDRSSGRRRTLDNLIDDRDSTPRRRPSVL